MEIDPLNEAEELRRQLDRASRNSAEMAIFIEMGRELAKSLDLADVGSVVTHAAISFTGAALCSLWVLGETQQPELISQTGNMAIAGLLPLPNRLSAVVGAFASKQPAIDSPDNARKVACAALPLSFGDTPLAVLDLVGFPFPEHMDEQVQALQYGLPIAALSLKNATVMASLRRAVDEIRSKNDLLESQNEELQAQNDEIQLQSQAIRAQNDELAGCQRELEQKNDHVERINRELAHMVEVGQQQEAQLQAIIDATADGLMVVDGEQKVIAINPALEAMIGYKAEELVGQTCKYLLGAHRNDGESLCDSTCPFLHPAGECPRSVDATVVTRDGQEVWVNVAYGPIYDKQGRPSAVVHAIRDITARKEIEQLKDEFLSMTAHDLKNPLTAIKGYAQLLHLRSRKDESRADDLKSLESIDALTGKVLEMINRLLDFTRVQLDRLELRSEPLDLVKLAARLVEQSQMTTDQHRLVLEVEAQELRGNWDRSYVEQVLTNLIDNAIKYSPQGGKIEIVLRRRDEEAVVAVRDQGPGIARADQAHLFERYFRSAQARKMARGLGIGLYICRGLIEAHGGRIWVESQEGDGSTFCFTLPLQPASGA